MRGVVGDLRGVDAGLRAVPLPDAFDCVRLVAVVEVRAAPVFDVPVPERAAVVLRAVAVLRAVDALRAVEVVELDEAERVRPADAGEADEPLPVIFPSSADTRPARPWTSSRICSSVSRTFFSSTASRRRCIAAVKSSKSSAARFCATPAPPAPAWKVRSTASRSASAAPPAFCDFLPFFSPFLAMARESTPATLHLRPHAPVAERVLLPGDPGRALRLAQVLMDAPKMLNHNRGLWGYTGEAADGEPLTIQSTGIGGPSAAIVVEELIALGARRLIRVGTCGALDGAAAIGSLLAADRVLSRDGASRALGAPDAIAPDEQLLAALRRHVAVSGTVVTTDLFYDARAEVEAQWREAGALAVEMEAATVLAAAARRGVPAACVLLVSNAVRGEWLDTEALHAAELELGRAGLAALGA